MHIKQGFLLKKIADEYTAIPYDNNYEELGAIVSLNHTGAFLWNCLEEDASEEGLTIALKDEYGINPELAEQAVSSFLAMLREHQLLED